MSHSSVPHRRGTDLDPYSEPGESDRSAPSWEAFAAYNRQRRAWVDAQVGERGREALRLLPLLLHLNEPGLPGHVADPACPVGVAGYSPTNADLALARRLFPRAQVRRRGMLRFAVDTVAVMGSAGTVGFTDQSDLDVWVCHRPGVGGRELALYRDKVQAVERWMNEYSGLEVHLFLQATERVRADDFGEADVEGCGSAMGALLKEEFYRTGVVLAGKAPFWWLVPPGADPEAYEAHLRRLRADPAVPSDEYVDLGCVARVPLGELFGAAIWQIVKGWKAPFKSVLKMGLLEKAVCSGRETAPLCETLKARVLAGERPDPYCVLFDAVLAHYREAGDGTTQDLLARCFYLKSGIRLDPGKLGRGPWGSRSEAVLAGYVGAWGWGMRRVEHLNDFRRWRFEWVQSLAKEVDRFFLRTYKRIRTALDASGEAQRITPRDLTVLGRKLQAVYRRAPHKVETLHLVDVGASEPSLSLYQETLPDGEVPWRLYRGHVTPLIAEEREGDVLRESADPIELLVWAAKNRILGSHTRLLCRSLDREVSAADLEGLAQLLCRFVADTEGREPPVSALLDEARPVRLLMVPNLGIPGEAVREVGALYATTWGETFYRRWAGPGAFADFVHGALVPFLLEGTQRARVEVYVPPRKVGTMRGPHRRLHRELPALVDYLGEPGFPEDLRRRHGGPAHEGYFVLERLGRDDVQYRAFRDGEGLLRFLSGVGPFRKVESRVEPHSGELAILRTVFDQALPGMLDIFVLERADASMLYVVDEAGNFIHFAHRREAEPYALAKLLLFLEGVVPEIARQPESPLAGRELVGALRIHTLLYDGTCRALLATHEHLGRARSLELRPTGLTIERLPGTRGRAPGYRIRWGDQILESGRVKSPLAELRRRIQDQRASGGRYEPYVTRLFLDEAFRDAYCGPVVHTGHYLFYKKAVEQRLSG
ncbi:MAG: class I adenylate cyclase [Deferrisomatales bacterium]